MRLIESDAASGKTKDICGRDDVDIGPVLIHPTTYALEAVGYEADECATGASKRSTVPRALSVSANTS